MPFCGHVYQHVQKKPYISIWLLDFNQQLIVVGFWRIIWFTEYIATKFISDDVQCYLKRANILDIKKIINCTTAKPQNKLPFYYLFNITMLKIKIISKFDIVAKVHVYDIVFIMMAWCCKTFRASTFSKSAAPIYARFWKTTTNK